MKIKYIHSANPKKEKIFDTHKAYKNMQFAINDIGSKLYHKTQQDFDQMYLEIFSNDEKKGTILKYDILAEEIKQ